MQLEEEVIKRSHWPISILSSIASLVNLFMPLVLVRYLTTDEVGLFKIFFLYLTMVPALSLVSGFLDGIAYWSGQHEVRRRVALQMSAMMMFSVGFLFSLMAIIVHEPIAQLLEWPESHALLFAISLFGAIAGTYLEESVIAQGRVWFGALFFSGTEILRAAVIIISVIISPSVTTVLVVHAAISVLKTFLSLIIGARLGLVGLEWDAIIFKEALRYAMPVSGAWVFGIFVAHADQFILSFYIPPTEFAFYTIGCLLIPPLFILEHSICRVMIPQLSEAFTAGKSKRAARLYREASENIAFLIIPAVTGMFVFAEPIVELLFTKTYLRAAEYLQIFCFSYLAIIIPFDAVARARAISGWLFKSFVIFSFVSLVLTVSLIVPYGAFGALAALLLVRFSMRMYSIRFMQRTVGWSLREMLPLFPLFQFSIVSIILAISCEFMRTIIANDFLWFLVGGVFFAGFYFLILSVWKVRRFVSGDVGKRVLMLLPTLGIGGMERMVLQLATALSRQGVRVYVFAYDCQPDSTYPDLQAEFEKAGIPVMKYGKSGKRFFAVAAIWHIVRFINTHDIQVIHSHNLGSLIHATLVKCISLHPIRIIHTQHSFVHLQDKSRYTLYEKLFSRFASVLVSVSLDTLEQYKKLGLHERKLVHIANGIQEPVSSIPDCRDKRASRADCIEQLVCDPLIKQKLQSLQDCIWFLNLARLDSIKGQKRVLQLWKELPASLRKESALLFVGPEAETGFLNAFFAEIKSLPDADRIVYCGSTTRPDQWYLRADIYISGSNFEGMPLGPLEALAHGLPCLLTDIPGHRFLNDQAHYFSLHTLTDGVSQLENLCSKLGSATFDDRIQKIAKAVINTYGIDEMARNYARLYPVR